MKCDVLIIIPTYNRYGWVMDILRKLYTDSSNYSFEVIVHDDASTDVRYPKIPEEFPQIKYIRASENGGKHGYWKSINRIFNEARNYEFDYMVQIDDDFELCDNFINVLVDLHKDVKSKDPKVVACGYTRNTNVDRRWGLSHWIDGGWICDRTLLWRIRYTIDKTHKGSGGSGVWKQLSQKIIKNGFHVGILPHILITHLGHTESRMHEKHRIKTPIFIKRTI
jgi:glycosyltransferase involved in cell wall biosynthesis